MGTSASGRALTVAEGFVHEIGIYSSDEEFRELICPFAYEGLAADEPLVFAYDPEKTAMLRSWLPASLIISYVTDSAPYATPGKALAAWRRLAEERLAHGARRVRIAGDVPHPGYGRPFAGWDRYEAAIDQAWGDIPVWAPCLYDARRTPPDVIERASRRHRRLRGKDGSWQANSRFQPPQQLSDFLVPAPDPLESTAPLLTLTEASPREMRAALRPLAEEAIGATATEEVLLAVSEACTNARVYGEPPARVTVWSGKGRLVVTVADDGPGPSDPLVGLLPAACDAEGGRGLWLSQQLDLEVTPITTPDGFTLRIRAGASL